MLGNCDSASATIFLLPGIYSIPGLYSSSISLHSNMRLLLKFLHVGLLWLVNILNCGPNKTVQNPFKFFTILRNYFYVTVHRVYSPVSLRLQKEMDFTSWLITAPR